MSSNDKSLSKYKFLWESVFLKEDIQREWVEHLKIEENYEVFKFILEANKLKDETNSVEKSNKMIYLVDTYIKKNAKEELNISGYSKTNFLDTIKTIKKDTDWSLNMEPFDVLLPIYCSIY